MRKKLVVGNWKMNGSLAANAALLDGLRASSIGCDAAVCVPFPYLAQAQAVLASSPVAWGAQNMSERPNGAFTGEVGASMLNDFSCRYVIVGHSERRTLYGETDALVAAKAQAALEAGLTPIVCVGETLDERDSGGTVQVVTRQLDAVIRVIGPKGLAASVLAYEPVWAIGTGRTASPQQAQEVHAAIRAQVGRLDAGVAGNIRILYGGSVKGSNAAELFAMGDVDGGLIGGASLVLSDFLAICEAGRVTTGGVK